MSCPNCGSISHNDNRCLTLGRPAAPEPPRNDEIADIASVKRRDEIADIASVKRRVEQLTRWLTETAPECFTEQKHLDDGTQERVYWHYGYAIALRDALRLLTGEQFGGGYASALARVTGNTEPENRSAGEASTDSYPAPEARPAVQPGDSVALAMVAGGIERTRTALAKLEADFGRLLADRTPSAPPSGTIPIAERWDERGHSIKIGDRDWEDASKYTIERVPAEGVPENAGAVVTEKHAPYIPAVVTKAITFDELVAHGIAAGANCYNGMPWSFNYEGQPITHENDNCYLVPVANGPSLKFNRGDMLLSGLNGELVPVTAEYFKRYQPEAAERSVAAPPPLHIKDCGCRFCDQVRGFYATPAVETPPDGKPCRNPVRAGKYSSEQQDICSRCGELMRDHRQAVETPRPAEPHELLEQFREVVYWMDEKMDKKLADFLNAWLQRKAERVAADMWSYYSDRNAENESVEDSELVERVARILAEKEG